MNIQAQRIKQISVAVMNENIAFPFSRYTPLHPGGELGLTLKQQFKPQSVRQFNVYAGGFYHKKVETGFYIRGEYLHQLIIAKKIGIQLPLGIGYMHTFYPGEIYELNTTTGEFEKGNQSGRPHLIANVGLGLTYINNSGIAPFIKQNLTIETPFANGIPLIPHSFIKLGVTIKISSNE